MPQSHETIPFSEMSQEERLAALVSYAKQNPKKYAEKKENLLRTYQINITQEKIDEKINEPVSEDVKELEALQNPIQAKIKRDKK